MKRHSNKVLIVDDEPRVLSAMRRRLSTSFNIVTAQNGAEALTVIDADLAGDEDIAVIVADMKMPGMTGVELLRTVRQRAPKIRRLMLTGNNDQETAIAAINEGQVCQFLTKPCEATVLTDALYYALDDYDFHFAKGDTQLAETLVTPNEDVAALLEHVETKFSQPIDNIDAGLERIGASALRHPEAMKSTEQIRKANHQLKEELGRLITIAKITTQSTLHMSDHGVDLVSLAREQVAAARPLAHLNDISIAFDTPVTRADIVADDGAIRAALNELITNGIRHNKRGGHVGVTLKKESDTVILRVLDTGSSVMPSNDDAPFGRRDIFAEREAPESPRHSLTSMGIGLMLVQAVARRHGAQFALATLPNVGSSATLTFSAAGFSTKTLAAG